MEYLKVVYEMEEDINAAQRLLNIFGFLLQDVKEDVNGNICKPHSNHSS